MFTARKKLLVLGAVLCLAGLLGFGLAALQPQEEVPPPPQQHKIDPDYANLDKLIQGEISLKSFAQAPGITEDVLHETPPPAPPPEDDSTKLLIVTASAACVAIGGATILGLLLYSALIPLKQKLSGSNSLLAGIFDFGGRSEESSEEPSVEKTEEASEKNDDADKANEQPFGLSELYTDCSDDADKADKADKKVETPCDEKPLLIQKRIKPLGGELPPANSLLMDKIEQKIRETILSDYHQSALQVQDSLKAQNASLEKQISELRQMAQSIKELSSPNAAPVKNTLDNLANQVSAIREYASYQRDRNEKLQEGYDWTIIRAFCLRVIRCIDNLENRITILTEQNADTAAMEEIMDELVFALESSGVEQFRPEINSDYAGQEKTAEVLKDRIHNESKNMGGKIAAVVSPGYQYVIDDGVTKVVRTARVKLYG